MTFYKELGKKLRDQHEHIDDKVECIEKYRKYINTELDSCYCKLANNYTPIVNECVPFTKKSGSMEVIDGLITIKPGQRVQIDVHVGYADNTGNHTDFGNMDFRLRDITNNIDLGFVSFFVSTSYMYLYSGSLSCQYTNDTDKNCQIGLVNTAIRTQHILASNFTSLTVQEINRQIVVDTLEHVNTTQGIEDTPVGHIISHMGTVAPKHYLICDGAEYNIEDYPYLAQHIEDNFGTINFFGGDGVNTFAVPDLRGEFLRGSGTATRNSGTGAAVGIHQNGTTFPWIYQYYNGGVPHITLRADNGNLATDGNYSYKNTDSAIPLKGDIKGIQIDGKEISSAMTSASVTSRPTNTSVLYCIKYEPTYFMNTYNTNYMQPSMYSEEERVVGCWIDGKPLYQKTVKYTVNNTDTTQSIKHNIANIERVVYLDLFIDSGYIPIGYRTVDNQVWLSGSANKDNIILVRNSPAHWADNHGIATIQYTKTTDEENSFTNDMLKDSYVELTYSNEEIADMIADILGGEE